MTEPVNILCLKWGTRYPAEYANKLYRGVARNLKRPFRFFCCTDNAEGLDPKIEIIPFPENPGVKRGWPDILVKLELTRAGFGDLKGPTLFLDLDIVNHVSRSFNPQAKPSGRPLFGRKQMRLRSPKDLLGHCRWFLTR